MLKKKIADVKDNLILEPIFAGSVEDPEKKQVNEPPVVHNKTSYRKLTKEISGPSIRSVMEGKEFNNEKVAAKEQFNLFNHQTRKDHFTQELLEAKWEIYLESLNDHPNLKTAINKKPFLNPDYSILLKIENLVQEELIRDIKPQLVGWLRRELNNDSVELNTEIVKEEVLRIAYTDAEKLEEMLKKNKYLALLKQKFHLDFDN